MRLRGVCTLIALCSVLWTSGCCWDRCCRRHSGTGLRLRLRGQAAIPLAAVEAGPSFGDLCAADRAKPLAGPVSSGAGPAACHADHAGRGRLGVRCGFEPAGSMRCATAMSASRVGASHPSRTAGQPWHTENPAARIHGAVRPPPIIRLGRCGSFDHAAIPEKALHGHADRFRGRADAAFASSECATRPTPPAATPSPPRPNSPPTSTKCSSCRTAFTPGTSTPCSSSSRPSTPPGVADGAHQAYRRDRPQSHRAGCHRCIPSRRRRPPNWNTTSYGAAPPSCRRAAASASSTAPSTKRCWSSASTSGTARRRGPLRSVEIDDGLLGAGSSGDIVHFERST